MSMTRRFGWVGVVALALLSLVVTAAPATAHVRSSVGYTEMRSDGDGDGVGVRLSLEYEILARATGLGTPAIEAPDDRARFDTLTAQREIIETYLDKTVRIFADEVGCDGRLEQVGVEDRDGVAYAALDLRYDCHGATDAYVVDYVVFSGLGSDAVVDDHTNIVDYDLDGEIGRVVLDGGHPGFAVGQQALAESAAGFAGVGVEHVLTSFDLALFVVALLLGATSVRAAVTAVSVFAAAHSVTLFAAVLGGLHAPAAVVQPVIALSIVWIAVENIVGGRRPGYRLALVSGLGMLHGLGLADALRFADEPSWGLVASLAGFNAGVELGQALVVLVLFPVLLVIRRFQWFSLAHLTATAAVAVTGLTWFVQRLI